MSNVFRVYRGISVAGEFIGELFDLRLHRETVQENPSTELQVRDVREVYCRCVTSEQSILQVRDVREVYFATSPTLK